MVFFIRKKLVTVNFEVICCKYTGKFSKEYFSLKNTNNKDPSYGEKHSRTFCQK